MHVRDEEYKGYTIEIHTEEYPEDPREMFTPFGKMVCFHKRYNLGDKHDFNADHFDGWDDFERHLIKEEGAEIVLPLYLYDHSGITMRTTSFSCRWDSGQVGFVYATRQDILENYLCKRISKKTRERAEELLKSEVKTYDAYLTGEVYGYVVKDPEGEDVEDGSVWGYYGDDEVDYFVSEAKKLIDSDIEDKQPEPETKVEKPKTNKTAFWHVPDAA